MKKDLPELQAHSKDSKISKSNKPCAGKKLLMGITKDVNLIMMTTKLFTVLLLLSTYETFAQQQTNLYFAFDQYELNLNARHILDTIIPDKKITSVAIYGHCDQLGTREYNYKLSERRANAVKAYLISGGFEAGKIKEIKYFGEDQPVIDKLDKVSRKANRRVVILAFYKTISADSIPSKEAAVRDPSSQSSKIQKNEKLADDIKDTAIKAGQSIILKNINFYGGLHRFLPSAYPALQDLLNAMLEIPTLVIEIEGHICCRRDGSDGIDNDTGEPFLSLNRARAVYEFLMSNGIDKKRMTYKGFGREHPIYEYEATEYERTANRRVEIKIIEK